MSLVVKLVDKVAWDFLVAMDRFVALCFAVVHVIDLLTFGLFSKLLFAMYLVGFVLFVGMYVRGILQAFGLFKRD